MSAPMLPSGNNDDGIVAWFKRPENKSAAFFWAIALVAVVVLWGTIVPWVLGVMTMTLQSLITGAEIAGILYILFGERPRIMWRVINRWFTSQFVALDPIGIRREHIAKTKDRKREADAAIGSVRGLRTDLEHRLELNKGEYQKYFRNVSLANKILHDQKSSAEQQHRANRCMMTDGKYVNDLEPIIASQQSQLGRYEESITKLTHLGEFCDDVIARKEREIRLEEDNQKEARSLKKLRSAMSAIFGKGGGIEDEMDEMARQQLNDEYNEEMGQFDQFMSGVTEVIASNDFNNLASMTELSEKLDKLNTTPVPKAESSVPVAEVIKATDTKNSYFNS